MNSLDKKQGVVEIPILFSIASAIILGIIGFGGVIVENFLEIYVLGNTTDFSMSREFIALYFFSIPSVLSLMFTVFYLSNLAKKGDFQKLKIFGEISFFIYGTMYIVSYFNRGVELKMIDNIVKLIPLVVILVGVFDTIVSIFLATPVEKELETNRLRGIRWLGNLLVSSTVIIICLMIIFPYEPKNVEKVKGVGKIDDWKAYICVIVVVSIFLLIFIYLAVDFWRVNYKRGVYLSLKGSGQKRVRNIRNRKYIIKRLSEDRVLVQLETNNVDRLKYQIIEMSDLKKYHLIVETREERSKRRHKSYNKGMKELGKKRVYAVSIIVIGAIFGLFYIIVAFSTIWERIFYILGVLLFGLTSYWYSQHQSKQYIDKKCK